MNETLPKPPVTPRLRLRNLTSDLAGPFDFDLAAGRCAAIGGASGAGKSLFLRMVADLDPSTGEASLDGRERQAFTAPEWRRQAVYTAAESGWWREGVLDHFASDRRDDARALAATLGLGEVVVEGPVSRLSTGERQRMALVRAFLLEPPVLLLDEPTGPLDPESTEKVEDLIRRRMATGTAFVIVTHDGKQANRLGAARYTMANRRLESVG